MSTPLLQKAFAQVGTLSADRQDAIAALVLEELASEERWDEQFHGSQDMLAALAEEALAEDKAGETVPLQKPAT